MTRIDLALPSAEALVTRACTVSTGFEQGLLVGRISDQSTDSTVSGARVRVVWSESGGRGADPSWSEVITDSQGVYRFVYRGWSRCRSK